MIVFVYSLHNLKIINAFEERTGTEGVGVFPFSPSLCAATLVIFPLRCCYTTTVKCFVHLVWQCFGDILAGQVARNISQCNSAIRLYYRRTLVSGLLSSPERGGVRHQRPFPGAVPLLKKRFWAKLNHCSVSGFVAQSLEHSTGHGFESRWSPLDFSRWVRGSFVTFVCNLHLKYKHLFFESFLVMTIVVIMQWIEINSYVIPFVRTANYNEITTIWRNSCMIIPCILLEEYVSSSKCLNLKAL